MFGSAGIYSNGEMLYPLFRAKNPRTEIVENSQHQGFEPVWFQV